MMLRLLKSIGIVLLVAGIYLGGVAIAATAEPEVSIWVAGLAAFPLVMFATVIFAGLCIGITTWWNWVKGK